MSRYVLDTDILSLYERGQTSVLRRMAAVPPSDRAITVITVEEQLSGWYALVRQAKQPADLARAYQRLADCVLILAGLPILSLTVPAIGQYQSLLAMKLNIRKNDCALPLSQWKVVPSSSVATCGTSNGYPTWLSKTGRCKRMWFVSLDTKGNQPPELPP